MSKNKNLHAARTAKNDEFFTIYSDVENEMSWYKDKFRDKVVYCNCDDERSSFWKYFHKNFHTLGLRKLIATHFDPVHSYRLEYNGGDDGNTGVCLWTGLEGNGGFQSPECSMLLRMADVVVTNPPFSLARNYIGQLMGYGKKFLIIGSMNAITYKEVFPLIRDGKVWLGCTSPKEFLLPDGSIQKFGNILWFTNLDHEKRHEPLVLDRRYTAGDYPQFDNYGAVNVSRVADIPADYDGLMGVPISFLNRHCPEQFDILGITCRGYSPEFRTKVYDRAEYRNANDLNGSACLLVDGKPKMVYERLLIRKR